MIRRMVDSLMTNELPEKDDVCSAFLLDASESDGIVLPDRLYSSSSSESDHSSTSPPSSPSRSSTLTSPPKLLLHTVDTVVSPHYPDGLLSVSSSCFVSSKPIQKCFVKETSENDLCKGTSSSSNEFRHYRHQSPSPGLPANSNLLPTRQPLGESLLQQNHLGRPQLASSYFNNSDFISRDDTLDTKVAVNVHATTPKTVEPRASSDALTNTQIEAGTASQADPLVMRVECLVLPFVQNLSEVELRFPTSKLNKEQHRILRKLATDNELFIMHAPKGLAEEPTVVLHKRASLVQRQRIEMEQGHRETLARARILEQEQEEKKKLESLRAAEASQMSPAIRETGCQAGEEHVPVGRKKYRRLRRERRRLAKQLSTVKKPSKTTSSMQTVPEDYWLCPWCLQHIAPEKQCGHEPICRAGVKQRQKENELHSRLAQRKAVAEEQRRLRSGIPLSSNNRTKQPNGKQPSGVSATPGRSRTQTILEADRHAVKRKSLGRTRSSSQTDLKTSNTITAKLETVHPNDLNAIVHLMQRVCSEPHCQRIADANTGSTDDSVARPTGTKCHECRRVYCDRHRPVGMHAACIAAATEPTVTTGASIACGIDVDEKKSILKAAIRERRAALMERRQRL